MKNILPGNLLPFVTRWSCQHIFAMWLTLYNHVVKDLFICIKTFQLNRRLSVECEPQLWSHHLQYKMHASLSVLGHC